MFSLVGNIFRRNVGSVITNSSCLIPKPSIMSVRHLQTAPSIVQKTAVIRNIPTLNPMMFRLGLKSNYFGSSFLNRTLITPFSIASSISIRQLSTTAPCLKQKHPRNENPYVYSTPEKPIESIQPSNANMNVSPTQNVDKHVDISINTTSVLGTVLGGILVFGLGVVVVPIACVAVYTAGIFVYMAGVFVYLSAVLCFSAIYGLMCVFPPLGLFMILAFWYAIFS